MIFPCVDTWAMLYKKKIFSLFFFRTWQNLTIITITKTQLSLLVNAADPTANHEAGARTSLRDPFFLVNFSSDCGSKFMRKLILI